MPNTKTDKMNRVRIKIVFLGTFPYLKVLDNIKSWKSDLFEIVDVNSTFNIVGNSDGPNWYYSDVNMERQIPSRSDSDILLAITNVRLQENFYMRRYNDNRICLTYHQMTNILKSENIPMENLILRVLYSVLLLYKRYGNRVPPSSEYTNYTHDDTRGCLFDMNGIKTNIIYSLDKPNLCPSCVEALMTNHENRENRIEKELIEKVQKELQKIRKKSYYRIADFIKKYPVLSIAISAISALVIGILGSMISNFLWNLFNLS